MRAIFAGAMPLFQSQSDRVQAALFSPSTGGLKLNLLLRLRDLSGQFVE